MSGRGIVGRAGPFALAGLVSIALLVALGPVARRDSISFHGAGFVLLQPAWLRVLAVLPWFVVLSIRSIAELSRTARRLSIAVRVLLVCAIVLSLSRPARREPRREVCAVAIVDVSDSISDAQLDAARRGVEALRAARGAAALHLVTFAARPRVVPIPAPSIALPAFVRPGAGAPEGDGAASDLDAAVRLAAGLCPSGTIARAVLFSDGNQTHGDLLAAASAVGMRLDVVLPAASAVADEVLVRSLEVPAEVKVGEPFFVDAEVRASRPVRVDLGLVRDGAPRPDPSMIDAHRTVSLDAGTSRFRFRARLDEPGPALFRLRASGFAGTDGASFRDRFAGNNEAIAATVAKGRPRVLFVEGDPAASTPLTRALQRERFEVTIGSLPEALGRYDLVVLSDVPASGLAGARGAALDRYVRDGGGLLFASGVNVSGAALAGSPVEGLLPVRFETERKRERQRLALVLAIDRSGSMTGEKLALAREAARASAELLGEEDLFGLIAFDALAQPLAGLKAGADRARLLDELARVRASGGTAFLPALEEAHALLRSAPAAIRHVILLTDGVASYDGIAAQCERMVRERITVSTVGVGAGADKTLLATIARAGGGKSYFTDDPADVPQLFVRDTTEVTRPPLVETGTRARLARDARPLAGVDLRGAPPLDGFTLARAEPGAEIVIVADHGEPLLVRGRAGAGRVVAWTSDVKNRWAASWLGWPGFTRLFVQLARSTMRAQAVPSEEGAPPATSTVSVEPRDRALHVTADVLGPDDRFVDGLDGDVEIREPEAPGKTRLVPLAQTGPGRYEVTVPVEGTGALLVRAEHRDAAGAMVATGRATASTPWPAEYAALPPDEALLRRAAEAAGGSVSPDPARVFSVEPSNTNAGWRDLRAACDLAAIGLLVLDVLLRRVRLFRR